MSESDLSYLDIFLDFWHSGFRQIQHWLTDLEINTAEYTPQRLEVYYINNRSVIQISGGYDKTRNLILRMKNAAETAIRTLSNAIDKFLLVSPSMDVSVVKLREIRSELSRPIAFIKESLNELSNLQQEFDIPNVSYPLISIKTILNEDIFDQNITNNTETWKHMISIKSVERSEIIIESWANQLRLIRTEINNEMNLLSDSIKEEYNSTNNSNSKLYRFLTKKLSELNKVDEMLKDKIFIYFKDRLSNYIDRDQSMMNTITRIYLKLRIIRFDLLDLAQPPISTERVSFSIDVKPLRDRITEFLISIDNWAKIYPPRLVKEGGNTSNTSYGFQQTPSEAKVINWNLANAIEEIL